MDQSENSKNFCATVLKKKNTTCRCSCLCICYVTEICLTSNISSRSIDNLSITRGRWLFLPHPVCCTPVWVCRFSKNGHPTKTIWLLCQVSVSNVFRTVLPVWNLQDFACKALWATKYSTAPKKSNLKIVRWWKWKCQWSIWAFRLTRMQKVSKMKN